MPIESQFDSEEPEPQNGTGVKAPDYDNPTSATATASTPAPTNGWESPYLDPLSSNRLSAVLRDKFRQDPALEQPGNPPNYGQFPIPHVMTLQGLVTTISRVYRISDEALNDSFDNARFMEYDVGILECLQPRIRSSVLLEYHVDPEDSLDPQQVFVCAEITKIIKGIVRWRQVLEQLSWAIWYGRSAVSFRYGWIQCGQNWYVAPESVPGGNPGWLPIHGDKLVFRLMDDRLDHPQNQIGIRVGQTYNIGDRIAKGPGREGEFWQVEPTDRGLAYFLNSYEQQLVMVHKHQIQDGAFERPTDAGRIHGHGLRSQLYWEWFMEKNTLQWLMEYVERSAFGLELWYYPLGNEKARTDAETAVKNRVGPFRNVLFVPVPPDDGGPGRQYGVDHVETGLAGAELLLNVVDKYFAHRRKRLVLGQTLTTEAEATGLGGNLASIHLLSFRDILDYDCALRDETVSDWINYSIKPWNFPGNSYWKARYVTETKPIDVGERLEALEKCQSMGAPVSVSQIYKAAGVTPPEPEDEIAQPMGAMTAGPGGDVDGFADGMQDDVDVGGPDETGEEIEGPEDAEETGQYAQYAASGWRQEDHPREPAGKPEGGEFKTHSVKLPKNRKKLSLQKAHAALEEMGFKLGPGRTDIKRKATIYDLTDPRGAPSQATVEQLRELVYRNQKPESAVEPKEPMQKTFDIQGMTEDQAVEHLSGIFEKAGQKVDGREVLPNVDNTSSIDSEMEDPEILDGIREVPMSVFTGLGGRSYSASENDRIDKLAEKIKASGKISPLIVVLDGHPDGPYILEGSHRGDALARLGAKSAPAMVVIDRDGVRSNLSEKYSLKTIQERIDRAARKTDLDTSHAQRHAGNYKKGTVRIRGLTIKIENPAGSKRHYHEENKGKKKRLAHHYGYISGYTAKDGGQVDVFLGPDPESDVVYVVDQVDPKTGRYDESKVLVGWYCEKEAREGYLANYDKGWKGLGSITAMTFDQLKEWLEKGNTKRPMEGQTEFYDQSNGPMLFAGQWF